MTQTPMTNEQKLDEIYEILKSQETARKRALWWGLFRRVFVYGLVIFLLLNPTFVMSKLTELLTPIVMNSLGNTMKSSEGADIFKKVKNVMQGDSPAE